MKTFAIRTHRNETPSIRIFEGIRATEKADNEMTDALMDFLEACREAETTIEVNPLPNGFEFKGSHSLNLLGSCRYILTSRDWNAFVVWAVDGIIQGVDFFDSMIEAADEAEARHRDWISEGWRPLENMNYRKSGGDRIDCFEYAAISNHTCTLWTAHVFWF